MFKQIGISAIVCTVIALGLVSDTLQHRKTIGGSTLRIDAPEWRGSGVAIGAGFILTAGHVAGEPGNDLTELTAVSDRGDKAKAKVLWANHAYDIALLRLAEPLAVAASRLYCTDPFVGEDVIAKGNPGPLNFVTTYGHVASTISEIGPWLRAYVVDITLGHGMSGGPVLDKVGRVIGLAVGGFVGPGNLAGTLSVAAAGSAACDLMAKI
jgi:S1-C subfamily serine protease